MTEQGNNTINSYSFFIPHVFNHITLNDLVKLIQDSSPYKGNEPDTSIGIVDRIESIPKINKIDGHPYYSCFVFMKEWGNNNYAKDLRSKLCNNEQSRIYYKLNIYTNIEYIVLLPNKSETSLMDAPSHTDLVLYLHTDIRLETVYNIMEGLDLGKIRCIEAELYSSVSPTTSNIWNNANPDIWKKKVRIQYNIIHIRFDYWYKTQTAYKFKEELKKSTYINIPVFDGTIWTFYETKAVYEDVNPYIWQS